MPNTILWAKDGAAVDKSSSENLNEKPARITFWKLGPFSKRSVRMHNYGAQTGELIGNEVVISDPALIAEILWIWAYVDHPDWDDEPKAISGSNFATAPCMDEGGV